MRRFAFAYVYPMMTITPARVTALDVPPGVLASVAVVVGILLASPARADDGVTWGMSEATTDQLAFDATQQLMLGQVMQGRPSRGSGGTTIARPVGDPRVPAKLAAAYPASSRAQMTRAFEQLLSSYRQLEKRLRIPPFDTAAALAGLVTASYSAATDTDVSERQFSAVIDQLRPRLRANESFRKASPQARQELYEQLAITGMYVAAVRASHPDPKTSAALRAAANAYLRQLVGVDASRVVIDGHGLSVH